MIILAIDPSIRNIGFAILQTSVGEIGILKEGTYYANNQDKPLQICYKAHFAILQSMRSVSISLDYLVIEMPQFMSGVKGLIAAQRGYTLDLALMVGFMAGKFTVKKTCLYTPMQWKGTAPKSATLAKYKRTFPDNEPHSEHSVDAVMIAHHFCKIANLI